MRAARIAIGFFVVAALLAAVAALLWPASRDTTLLMGATFALLAGSVGLTSWPQSLALIEQRPRLVMAVGWSLCVGGLLAGIGFALVFASQSSVALHASIYVGVIVSLAGMLIAALPRMARKSALARADFSLLKQRRPETPLRRRTAQAEPMFSGVREGLAAPLSVLREWRMFLQISLPWALLLGLALYLLAAFANTIGEDRSASTILLLCLLLILLVGLYLAVPTVAVAWFRFTIQGRRPETYVALPDRAALGLAWRLWLSLSVLGSCDGLATTQATALAARMIPALDAPSVGYAAGWVLDILALMLASSFALRLPARAVGDPALSQTMALAAGRRMWPGLPVGLILSLAPAFILGWVADLLVGYLAGPAPHVHGPGAHLDPLAVGGLGLASLVVFAAVASGASYLSRAYLAAKAAIPTLSL